MTEKKSFKFPIDEEAWEKIIAETYLEIFNRMDKLRKIKPDQEAIMPFIATQNMLVLAKLNRILKQLEGIEDSLRKTNTD